MAVEGRKSRLTSLFLWPFFTPVVLVVAFAVMALATGEIPESAYLLTDPVAFPALSLTMGVVVLLSGVFTGPPFTPRPPPGAPPHSARWGLRGLGALAVLLSFAALHFVILRGAVPTKQAVGLLKKHATAGKAIGSPVEIGWGGRGYIHAEASVNDEHVPAHIDAGVPVSGPRGSGVLSIEGRHEGARWVFTRVSLRLDKGGERIDIVGAPAPARRGSGEIDETTWLVIGGVAVFAGLLFTLLWWLLRSTDPARAIASLEAPAGAPITLRFTTRKATRHRIWLRFEIDYQGGEDGYGVTVQLRIEVPGQPPFAVEHRIGDRAPELGPQATTNTSLYRAMTSSGPDGEGVRATAAIFTLPVVPAGTEVVATGRVVVAEGQKPFGLLLFVLPL